MPEWGPDCVEKTQGFGLIEMMIALIILTFGLLATGQLLYAAAGMGCLSRSKSTAAIAAQNSLELLSELYQRNPSANELTPGNHGPIHTQVLNPIGGSVMNRYKITWVAGDIADPRPGRVLKGREVRVCVTPMQSEDTESARSMLSKTLTVTTILGPEIR